MTSITVHYFISYPSLQDSGATRRQIDWDCTKLVKCIKGEKINGHLNLTVGGAIKTFREQDSEDVAKILLRNCAKKINTLVSNEITIVPVPNSGATVGSGSPFRTLECAEEIASRFPSTIQAVPALRWKSATPSSRKGGGSRDPQVLSGNLQVVRRATGPVVIFDDVMTTGGHIIAAYRVLKASGVRPIFAVAMGRTTWKQEEKMMGWRQEELEVEAQAIDWDSFDL